jgi:hypothetical protein
MAKKWTQSDVATLYMMWTSGVFVRDVAKALGRTENACRRLASAEGWARPEGFRGGRAHAERRKPMYWTPDRVNRVLLLRSTGLTWSAIALMVGATPGGVKHAAQRYAK